MKKTLAFSLSIFFALPSVAATLPPDFEARYSIRKGILEVGQAVRTLSRHADGALTYSSETKTTGITAFFLKENLSQFTRFEEKDGFIRPLEYRYKRVGHTNKTVVQTYQWQKAEVNSRVDDETYVYEMPPRTLDQNVYQLGLMLDLADGRRNMRYEIGENVRLKSYDVKLDKRETIVTPLGRVDTVVVYVREGNNVTTLWAAPDLAYLPVRIEHSENGSTFSAILEALSGIPRSSKTFINNDDNNGFD